MADALPTVEDVLQLFQSRGDSQYGGECVSQLEHALQAAALAEQENAPAELIAAALLHDVGHLLHQLPDDAPDQGVDDHHEASGDRYLRSLFPPAVTEPVRLHVPAKRYLCGKDPSYAESLSEPSRVSLRLQGGAMTAEEQNAFEQNPHAEAAVRLRRWDDLAKASGLETPTLEHFARYLRQTAVTPTGP